jgi:hypothetical protein
MIYWPISRMRKKVQYNNELNKHLPKILQKRDLPLDPFLNAIEKLTKVVINFVLVT